MHCSKRKRPPHCPIRGMERRRDLIVISLCLGIMFLTALVGEAPSFSAKSVRKRPSAPKPCISSHASLPLVSNVFGSGMVLQQGVPVAIWGWTNQGAGGVVEVFIESKRHLSEPANAVGRWTVTLPPMVASPHGVDIRVTDPSCSETTTLAGVLFGEVVWCSGQSNICGNSTPVSFSFNASAELAAAAAYPWIRVFAGGVLGGSKTALPQLEHPLLIPWSSATPVTLSHFAAACWFHGRELANALGPEVPIGLIEEAWSGTPIQVSFCSFLHHSRLYCCCSLLSEPPLLLR
jgi:hypothetical protein